MWLFDGIFGDNKPTTPAQQTPVATVNTQNSVVAPAVDPAPMMDFLNASSAAVTPNMPSYTEQKANGQPVNASTTDASTILMDAPAPVMPIQTEASALINDPILSPVPEVASMQPALSQTQDTSNPLDSLLVPSSTASTPVMTESRANPVVTSSESLISENNSPVVMTESPVIANESVNPIFAETPVQSKDASEISGISESKSEPAFDLFGTIEADENPKNEEPAFDIFAEKSNIENTEEKQQGETIFGDISNYSSVQNTDETSENTASFLVKALAELDEMEASLNAKKQKYLDEAAEYKIQKEKFAELEKAARNNSHSMDDEKSRIDTMRNYFKNQQKKQVEGSDVTESVNTTLTAVGVKNSVDKAIDGVKKPRKTTTRTKQAA